MELSIPYRETQPVIVLSGQELLTLVKAIDQLKELDPAASKKCLEIIDRNTQVAKWTEPSIKAMAIITPGFQPR